MRGAFLTPLANKLSRCQRRNLKLATFAGQVIDTRYLRIEVELLLDLLHSLPPQSSAK
jgi:hypothetical protein